MNPSWRTAARAFTLIEILISTVLAMLMVSLALSAFFQFRKLVARSEARMAMCTSAQNLFAYMHAPLASLQQSCAFVADSRPGRIRIVFMRAKEQVDDYLPILAYPPSPNGNGADLNMVRNDLSWEEWVWDRADQTLSIASNSTGTPYAPGRVFQPTAAFTPSVPAYAPVTYGTGKWFVVSPQARRTLDPTAPFGYVPPAVPPATGPFGGFTLGGLNDNIVFPNAAAPPVSQVNAAADLGDFDDLERLNKVVVLNRVSDLSWELVAHDGTTRVIDDSAAATLVLQGVWLDGRVGPTPLPPAEPTVPLSAAPVYAGSDVARRPRTLRLRFTLHDAQVADPTRAVDPVARQNCTFSFSFALPGLSSRQ